MTREKSFSTLSSREKAIIIMAWMAEHKGRDIVAFDLSKLSPVTEIMIVVSASSARHARSLAEGLMDLCVQKNYEFLRMEGQQGGLWILSDLNDIVVHVFQEHVRELYNLEGLWRDAQPVEAAPPAPKPVRQAYGTSSAAPHRETPNTSPRVRRTTSAGAAKTATAKKKA